MTPVRPAAGWVDRSSIQPAEPAALLTLLPPSAIRPGQPNLPCYFALVAARHGRLTGVRAARRISQSVGRAVPANAGEWLPASAIRPAEPALRRCVTSSAIRPGTDGPALPARHLRRFFPFAFAPLGSPSGRTSRSVTSRRSMKFGRAGCAGRSCERVRPSVGELRRARLPSQLDPIVGIQVEHDHGRAAGCRHPDDQLLVPAKMVRPCIAAWMI